MLQIKCDCRSCYGSAKPTKEAKGWFEIAVNRTLGELGGTVHVYKMVSDKDIDASALHACSWAHAQYVAKDAVDELSDPEPEVQTPPTPPIPRRPGESEDPL
jgi:hypothetical protein